MFKPLILKHLVWFGLSLWFGLGVVHAVDRDIPDLLLQRIEAIRMEMRESDFRTHPAQLRNLQIRADLLQQRLANAQQPDEEGTEQALEILRREWLKSARALAREPLRTGVEVPDSVQNLLAPIEVEADWSRDEEPFGLRLKLKARPSSPFADLNWSCRVEVPEPWILSEPQSGPVGLDAEAEQTWHYQLRLPEIALMQRRAIEASVRLSFYQEGDASRPLWSRRIARVFGDASIPCWRIRMFKQTPEKLLRTPSDLRALVETSFQGPPQGVLSGEDLIDRVVRADPPTSFDIDPFLVSCEGRLEGACEQVWATTHFSSPAHVPQAILTLTASQPAEVWLDRGPLDSVDWHALSAPDWDQPLHRAEIRMALVPGDHRLDLLVQGTSEHPSTIFSAQWTSPNGDPLILTYPSDQ